MAEIRLYDSTVCRLCAESNDNGEMLFTEDSEETELSAMVNRYLPLKVHDDGKLPRTICPGCNIQLEATVQFFELLINGQQKIREMWKEQVEQERKTEKEQLKQRSIHINIDSSEIIIPEDDNSQNESTEQQIIVNVLPDGSIYTAEHDISLQMEGLDKPKRKRGRPPKSTLEEDVREVEMIENIEIMSQEEYKQEEDEFDGDGRKRRKRKVPMRYMETVQGKELDKIFKEEGVFDDDDAQIKYEPEESLNFSNAESSNSDTEIIGHLETMEGKNLGELVVVNKNKIRSKAKMQKSKIRKKYKFTCSYCGKGFFQRSKYVIHKNFHESSKYECTECKNEYSKEEDLILHQKAENHSGERVIGMKNDDEINADPTESNDLVDSKESLNILTDGPAITSNVHFSITDEINESDLNNYNNREESSLESRLEEINDNFRCDKCNKHFQSKVSLKTHIRVVHEGEKPFVCEVCNKAFAYESSLKGHKEIAHPTNKTEKGFPCDICGKVLNHPSSIMYHKLTEHNDGRRFVCNKCGKSFKHKQLLHRHQLVHSEDRPYPCNSCNASFKTKANLLNHQSTHTGEKKHFCEMCEQKFAHKTSLTLHYRTHTGQKPYKCDVCAKSFSQNGNLQEHLRIHTGEKPYCCDHCGRKFTTSSQFKLHVKRHTGERPWKCEFCAKSFLHKDTWKCHVRRHTGERPFQCAYCNRGFTEQWALKKHLRLHTGEKPYNCDICGKAFADCSNLTKHKKVHKKSTAEDSTEAEESKIEEVWQIVQDPNNKDPNAFTNSRIKTINSDEASEDGMSQIIYVAYQDAENSNESATLQYSKGNIEVNQESNLETAEENEDPIHVELPAESDLQLQIQDEDGNTIPLSIQEARQLLSDGQLVSQLNGGQTIRVQGLPTHLEMNSNTIISEDSAKSDADCQTSTSTIQTDAEAIVKVLEDEDTDATTVAAINQLNAEDRLDLADGQQAIEFITQDGQKVRLVTSLNIDPSQLTSEYLTIV